MAKKPIISVETLRQLITYDPDTGALTWLPRPVELFVDERAWKIWTTKNVGKPALASNLAGYRHGGIFRRCYLAHRVGFALYNGHWPTGDIDHINGARSDNRIINLRDVTHKENLRNQAMRDTNKSGANGVMWFAARKKWTAQITVDGKTKSLGYFVKFDEAVKARKAAEMAFGFHSNHGRA